MYGSRDDEAFEEPTQQIPVIPDFMHPDKRITNALINCGILAIPALGFWFLALEVPQLKVTAIVVTGICVILIVLRLLRGSVKEAEWWFEQELLAGCKPLPPRLEANKNANDRIVWWGRLHPLVLFKIILTGAPRDKVTMDTTRKFVFGVVAAMMAVAWLGGQTVGIAVDVAIVVLYIITMVYEWRRDLYALTNDQLVAVVGLVSSNVLKMPRARLTDIQANVPWQANVLEALRIVNLAWGILDVENAGQDQALKRTGWIPGVRIIVKMFRLDKSAE